MQGRSHAFARSRHGLHSMVTDSTNFTAWLLNSFASGITKGSTIPACRIWFPRAIAHCIRPGRATLKRQSTLIANWIVRGSFETLVGGGTSVEGEINNLLVIPSQVRAKRGDVLVIGPGGLQIVLEEKEFFATPDDLLYRTERDATEAGEESEPEDVYIFEIIPGIMSNVPGELYTDRNVGMEAYRYVEEALAWVDSQIPAGTSATIPMSTIFPGSGGWQLTHIGAAAGVGSKPIGDPGGAHVHYNIAVPFATIPEFLREVGSRTWRDQVYGYHTRAHLADGLDFAAMATTRFLAWTATGQIPSSPADLGDVIDAPIREAQELRGHLALLYVSSAALVNGKIRLGPLTKHTLRSLYAIIRATSLGC